MTALADAEPLRRQFGVAQQQKTALEIDSLRAVPARIPGDVRGFRDRALLINGGGGVRRRSELAALGGVDLRFERNGLVIQLQRSKMGQETAGEAVAVPSGAQAETCPVRAKRACLAVAWMWRPAGYCPRRRCSSMIASMKPLTPFTYLPSIVRYVRQDLST